MTMFAHPTLGRWPQVAKWDDAEWSAWLSQHGWTLDRIKQYLDHDRYAYGFGLTASGERATVATAHELGTRWLYTPTPRGVTLHEPGVPNLLWGGSVGGTKSTSARWEAIRCCDTYEDFRVIIVRRELEQLRRTHMDTIDKEIKQINRERGNKSIRLTDKPAAATFEHTGSKIVFAHCHARGDEEKYLGEHYDLFIGDEATQLLPEQIVGIAGRLRNDPKLGFTPRMMLTTNPGGPAHDFCVSRFIDKDVPIEDDPKYAPDEHMFIQASLYDNPFFMDTDGTYATYEKRLSAYAPARRKQLLNGDWSAVVGQFFGEFSSETHAAVLGISNLSPWYGVLVYGFNRPSVFYFATWVSGHLYLYCEETAKGLLISDVAAQIIKCARALGIRVPVMITDPLMDEANDQVETTTQTFRRFGVPCRSGSHGDAARVQGWQRLRAWLANAPDGRPWLIVNPSCKTFIKAMGKLLADPDNPEDIVQGDDVRPASAVRFLVEALQPPALAVPKEEPDPNSIAALRARFAPKPSILRPYVSA